MTKQVIAVICIVVFSFLIEGYSPLCIGVSFPSVTLIYAGSPAVAVTRRSLQSVLPPCTGYLGYPSDLAPLLATPGHFP
jgi:hypothetical protein